MIKPWFGSWKGGTRQMVDIEKTKQFYSSLKQDDLCGCNYCKNYSLHVKEEYPQVAAFLSSFGIDIEKPFETSPLEPDANGYLEYCCCQYIVLGTPLEDCFHQISGVDFRIATSYPSTGVNEKHFVLELCSIKLKMELPL